MLYNNQYNRGLAHQLHNISQRYVNHALVVGGAILGGTVVENSDSESDYDNVEGGNGFAEGTHLDTGFGPTLGASPTEKITKETILKEAKLAQGGKAKNTLNSAHQTLMGGPQMGLGKREGKGFWDSFKKGFDKSLDVLGTVGKVGSTAAALYPLYKLATGGAELGGTELGHPGLEGGHELKDKNVLPSSAMGGAKNLMQNANAAFDVDNAPEPGKTVQGSGLADQLAPVLKHLGDYAKRKGRNLKVSDFEDLSKEKVFDVLKKEALSELAPLLGNQGKGRRAKLQRELKGRGVLGTLLKFAPLLLGLGKRRRAKKEKGAGILADLAEDIGLGKRKRRGRPAKGKGEAALDKGTNEEIADLPRAQAESGGKKRGRGRPSKAGKGIISSALNLLGLGKKEEAEKGVPFLPQEVLSKRGKGKAKKEKEEEVQAEGGRKLSRWAQLIRSTMASQKFKKMSEAIAHIKKNNLYKKNA